MRKARLLLLPIAALYWVGISVRNLLYNIGVLRQRRFATPVICVGNITVGGTGKTPLTEHVVRLLRSEGHHVGIVSRGYKRKTKGQIVATTGMTAEEIGDEPCQMKRKFPWAEVVVDADRAAAIDKAVELGADVVVMDDGMQHRSVVPRGLMLVVDYARPMWCDWPLPAGNLREDRTARLRADIIIINKCPADMTKGQAENFMSHMSLNDGQKVYFCTIDYGALVRRDGSEVAPEEAALRGGVAVAGIGRPDPFFVEVESRMADCRTRRMSFPDHHAYTESDMTDIVSVLNEVGPDSVCICTEKDSMRLPDIEHHETWILPIKLKVLFGQEDELNRGIDLIMNKKETD